MLKVTKSKTIQLGERALLIPICKVKNLDRCAMHCTCIRYEQVQVSPNNPVFQVPASNATYVLLNYRAIQAISPWLMPLPSFLAIHYVVVGVLSLLCNPLRKWKLSWIGSLSPNRDYILDVFYTKLKKFADRVFSVYGPKLWNTLPDHLRCITDYNTFNSKLKTYMFKKF